MFRPSVVLLLTAIIGVCQSLSFAEVDQRKLSVRVIPAFSKLQWPSWITGADEGRAKNLLPVALTHAGDGSGRVFVATQYGHIFSFEGTQDANDVQLFLDLSDRVRFNPNENEEGLLGLAFHPKFAENGELFVYYTPAEEGPRQARISQFTASDDRKTADPNSEEQVISVEQPYWNHNGGTIVFGPDGYLYAALGDGGKYNDPHMNGQNLQTLLGAILRINVDQTTNRGQGKKLNYSIPSDNPFFGQPKFARPEIWAYGLRNVWRMSFDQPTGLLWAADVGQNAWEEINLIQRGGNYGWNLREGFHSFGPWGAEKRDDLVEPIWEYGHDVGKSITGGCVYRGSNVPELEGAYLYADYVSGRIWALSYNAELGEVTANRPILEKGPPIMTFGEDEAGEVYLTSPLGEIFTFASP